MENWIIVVFALWTYPVFSGIVFFFTRKNLLIQRIILIASLLISTLAILGVVYSTSTTSKTIDWQALTFIYFTACWLLWKLFYSKLKAVKILAISLMVIFFGLGYFSSTFGIIGVSFLLGDVNVSHETHIGDKFIYKETGLGNAVSDYRGKRVEIYRTSPFLPFIEWRIIKREYFDVHPYVEPLAVEFNSTTNEIYLSVNDSVVKNWGTWNDTIQLK